MPKVIAITSEKGGVGKSTVAIHLAGALAERGLMVALIDEDGRVGSSSYWAKQAQQSGGLAFPVWDAEQVKPKAIKDLDALIIDTEGRPKRKELRQLAKTSDLILVPTGTSSLELEATRQLLDFFEQETCALHKIRVLLTRVPMGNAAQDLRESLRDAGIDVCNTLVRSFAVYQKAAEAGALVKDMKDGRAAAAWNDILALSREVL